MSKTTTHHQGTGTHQGTGLNDQPEVAVNVINQPIHNAPGVFVNAVFQSWIKVGK